MNMILRNSNADVRAQGRCGGTRSNTTNDRTVVNISVAFQRSWPKKDAQVNPTGEFDHRTAWIEFACWGPAATRAESIQKGDIVECEFNLADLVASVYTDKDGQPKASIKCERANVSMVYRKEAGATSDVPADQPIEEPVAEPL